MYVTSKAEWHKWAARTLIQLACACDCALESDSGGTLLIDGEEIPFGLHLVEAHLFHKDVNEYFRLPEQRSPLGFKLAIATGPAQAETTTDHLQEKLEKTYNRLDFFEAHKLLVSNMLKVCDMIVIALDSIAPQLDGHHFHLHDLNNAMDAFPHDLLCLLVAADSTLTTEEQHLFQWRMQSLNSKVASVVNGLCLKVTSKIGLCVEHVLSGRVAMITESDMDDVREALRGIKGGPRHFSPAPCP